MVLHRRVNMYPDGSATIPWHCDDEPEIDPSSDIVCVSLGNILANKLSILDKYAIFNIEWHKMA